jgi:hypothetical protein
VGTFTANPLRLLLAAQPKLVTPRALSGKFAASNALPSNQWQIVFFGAMFVLQRVGAMRC